MNAFKQLGLEDHLVQAITDYYYGLNLYWDDISSFICIN